MLHTIVRHTPLTLLVISVLFSGLLSIATAQETADTTDRTDTAREASSTDAKARVNPLQKTRDAIDAKRKEFQERAAQLRADKEARRASTTERRAERRARVSEKVENRVRTVIANAKSRLERAMARLSSVADRIEARAKVLADRGIVVDGALALVAQARIELRAAAVLLGEELPTEVDAALVADEPKAAFEYVKTSMQEVKEHLMKARQLLREAVAALKAAVAEHGTGVDDAVTNRETI